MIRQVQFVIFFLLMLGLVFIFIPENKEKTPESQFLALAVACHMNVRPIIEEVLLSQYNLWKIDESCGESHERISSEIRSSFAHALRSKEHGYEIIFTPRVVKGEVDWSCESSFFVAESDCRIGT